MAGPALHTRSDADAVVRAILTVSEIARELRCSKAHVHHLISGKVRGARPLPSLWLGRRRLVLRESLDAWVKANEKNPESVL